MTVEATGDGFFKFEPPSIEIKSGETVRLTNASPVEHNLTIDKSGEIPTSLASKSDRLVIKVNMLNKTAQAPIDLPPGTYQFYCSIDFGTPAGHAQLDGSGQAGTLIVH